MKNQVSVHIEAEQGLPIPPSKKRQTCCPGVHRTDFGFWPVGWVFGKDSQLDAFM